MKIKHLSRVLSLDWTGREKKAYRKLRRKLHLTGKQIKPKLFPGSSARGYEAYSSGGSVYGPTGSIVGRY